MASETSTQIAVEVLSMIQIAVCTGSRSGIRTDPFSRTATVNAVGIISLPMQLGTARMAIRGAPIR